MRLLIDLPSIAKTALFQGEDKEFGKKVEHNGNKVQVNGWQHGHFRFTGYMLHVLEQFNVQPHDVIFVNDGHSATARRKAAYPAYKSKRAERAPEIYEQYNQLLQAIRNDWRGIGAHFVDQPGVEADDVIAYLAQNLKGNIIIVSNDSDMSVLLSGQVQLLKDGVLVTDNPLGPFSPKFVTLYKAIVGDASDTIKGAYGFGKQAWLDLLVWADEPGLAALDGMVQRKTLHELADDVAEFKPLQKIIDSAEGVYASYQAAKLHPEWVNTLRTPLQWSAGIVLGCERLHDSRLAPYAQQVRLVTRDNYDKALEFFLQQREHSPAFSLDLETSTPDESDEWLATRGAPDKVDVFGSDITGMGLTFGANGQYTYYFSVDHADTPNIALAQLGQIVAAIPAAGDVHLVIHNASFELPLCHAAFGEAMKDNGWHGFLPNIVDTKNTASYVDENLSLGLKKQSAHWLGYEQQTYESVTQIDGQKFKMNQLSGQHVLSYGADDTICTLALYHFHKIIMEVEGTWETCMEVEQLPAYVTALAFHQGTKFDLAAMKEMEREDAITFAEHEVEIAKYLRKVGWPGTQCPELGPDATPAQVKEMVRIVLGVEMQTQVRKLDKLAALVGALDHEDAGMVGALLADGKWEGLNALMKARFIGAARLDTDSPKQMKEFLYDTMKLPVRVVGSCTELERKNKPELAEVVRRYKRIWAGSKTERPLTPEEAALLKQKAKTNETAIGFALVMDGDHPDIGILEHIQKMKKVETRRKMYYEPYANLRHWKDNRVHAQVNQNGTVTRRYASSDPNLQQLPKKGDGVKFRRCFVPHHKNAVICSIDFSGQELRQGAGQSQDPNMLACYVGDHKKDMHSMTAAGAMRKKWGDAAYCDLALRFDHDADYDLFMQLRKSDDKSIAKMADDLRKSAKNVNFGAQYDAQAPKLAETLIIPVEDAEAFLQAKFAMFPRFEKWKEEVKAEAQNKGCVTTPLGARRHLRESLLSDQYGVADKALRQGPNFKIQGASAEQTKLAMARLWRSGILHRLDMVFFAPIHDELVWSVSREHALESIKVIHDCMTQPYGGLPVPFLGSVSLGLNFGDQVECGDDAMENPELLNDRVPEILAALFKEPAHATA